MKTCQVSRKDFIVPLCNTACPAGVDVPRYIRAVRQGRYHDAVAVLRERLPLPTVCADACFAPCEDACAYKQLGDPLAIRALKRAAVDNGDDSWLENKKQAPSTGKTVAVVGAGPAGLTTAYYLATKGHGVTLYDAWPEPGGTLRFGVPQFRLPKARLARDIDHILDLGVVFKGNTRIGDDMDFSALTADHDAVFLGCGAMASIRSDLTGWGQGDGVILGWDFLKAVSQGREFNLGDSVAVLGGGNVAVDAARTAIRLGVPKVSLVYRRTRNEMPAHPDEIAAAEAEGVSILENWAPDKVICDNQATEPAVTGLALISCTSEGDGGRECRLILDEDITTRVDANTIIVAIGQKADLDFLSDETGLLSSPDELKIDPDTLETGIPGVFAGGDVVTGPDSIVNAIAQGRKAAEAMDRHLGGSGDVSETLAPAEETVDVAPLPTAPVPRQAMPQLQPWQCRAGFDQAETGLSPEQVEIEAGRCLDCDARKFEVVVNPEKCKECGYCRDACQVGTFGPAEGFNQKGYRPMAVNSSAWCVGCLKCFYVCPDFAIDIIEKHES